MLSMAAQQQLLRDRELSDRGVTSILQDLGEGFNQVMTINVVSRQEWGAREPRQVHDLASPIKRVGITFNSETAECKTREECCKICRELQNRDMDEKDLSDIAFNWLVGGDGCVYEGRGWKSASELHLSNPYANFDKMIDVAYIGNFEGRGDSKRMHQIFVNWLRQQIQDNLVSRDFEYK